MRRKARRGGGKQAELTIEGLGARGDGVAQHDGRPVFVPFALPGERARVKLTGAKSAGYKGELIELLSESADRVEPVCPHYGPCGGCTLQHLAPEAYRTWKRQQVLNALQREGVRGPDGGEPNVAELTVVPAGTRRRATLTAKARRDGVDLGFHGRESHVLEHITTCYVLRPRLVEVLPGLSNALRHLLKGGESASVTLLDADNGVDVLVRSHRPPGLDARQALAALAEQQDLARVTWLPIELDPEEIEAEPVSIRRPPFVHFGEIAVEPEPGSFLQPTAEGQTALIEAVTGWLKDAGGPLADFYAGCGTFTFPLARYQPVHAVEGERAAIASLWQAARRNDYAGPVTAEVRDLVEEPPAAEELDTFAGVVFDPPRAGAKALARELADSRVPTVVAVSCNANTFARDARLLVEGGYTLAEVRPIDQFPWSGHLELVARFHR
ncbi:23S rRNA m(5)U-1939 methyltransferase [Limimonas halophila]|uniref:23S rRNA m(5)U-1939 methyltransferase n=1 Tax=Limimonas halophila TaxID=1082479 RepID=A0A1G7TC78_9PROT|nr:23S rRNA (uracil(1939)-C(5))-methyltransferase RlmD [Limimonas halophila]SDG32916.1 23S rRNA m(5)U-1939 methyltransferase [Limimonas halophila]